MDLIFEKKEQYWGKDAAWVSEFEATSDFNLHIERISSGRFLVYQKSVADGEYDLVDGLGYKDHKAAIDMDFVALVYPKWIKVVSEAEVTRAVVVTDGEIGTGGNGGGENDKELKRNDVNFFDYDGTLLYAYSWEEAKELTELPAAPSHDGMTFKEWNYTLDDIKAQSSDEYAGKSDIGAVFVDGNGMQVESPKDVIILPRGTEFIDEMSYSYQLVRVLSIPNTVNTIAYSAFFRCTFRYRVVVPSSVEEWDVDGYHSFNECTSPDCIWDNTRQTVFTRNMGVSNFVLEVPEWCTSVDDAGFMRIGGVVVVPKNIANIENAFGNSGHGITCYFKDRNDIPTSYYSMSDYGNVFVVPDHLYDEWTRATNWVGASIVKRSDYGNL